MCHTDFHNAFMTRTRSELGIRIKEKRIRGRERDVKNRARDVNDDGAIAAASSGSHVRYRDCTRQLASAIAETSRSAMARGILTRGECVKR